MRKIIPILFLLTTVSCNDDDFMSDLVLLSKNWQMVSVTLNGSDITSNWNAFSQIWEFSTGSTRAIIIDG